MCGRGYGVTKRGSGDGEKEVTEEERRGGG